MPISPEQFALYYPRLYHMAEAGVWPSIQRHGLLSTVALLDLFEINDDRRRAILSEHRPESVTITHPVHGSAVIRDQKPMRESALRKCLRGMTPQQWYEMLNERVFFWVTPARVQTLLNARAYRNREHTVITLDTAGLVAKYASRMFFSPINSGSTIYNPQERGRETFRALQTYPFEERSRLRGRNNAVAEVAVIYAVPDLPEFTACVEHKQGTTTLAVLYKRP